MPRDPNSVLPATVWASGQNANIQTPEEATIVIINGFDARFSEQDGLNPTRQLFNWIGRTIFALLKEINDKGMPEWDSSTTYTHPCHTIGSDGVIYRSKLSSTNQNPTAPGTQYWEKLVNTDSGTLQVTSPPNATSATRGILLLATQDEVNFGTVNDKAVTPATLQGKLATETVLGLVRFATSQETIEGTVDNKAISPNDLSSRTATVSRSGIVQFASDSEVDSGTNQTRAINPENLQRKIDNLNWVGTQAEFDAIAVKNDETFYNILEE